MKQKETQKEETSVKVKAQEEGIPQEKTAKERKEVAQFEGEQSETGNRTRTPGDEKLR